MQIASITSRLSIPYIRIFHVKPTNNALQSNTSIITINNLTHLYGAASSPNSRISISYGRNCSSTYQPMNIILEEEHEVQQRVEKIRKQMRRNQESKGENDMEELIMMDVLYRVGLEDYFREDIHVILHKHYAKLCRFEVADLSEVALQFRLLRQSGYYVTADVFNKFKGNDGRFKQELENDVLGLSNLYEASHLSLKGEDIMDEASQFSEQLLKASICDTSTSKANVEIIESTLNNPHHKNLARLLLAKSLLNDFEIPIHFLHDFGILEDWVKEVKDLAKLDFESAQTSHRNTIHRLSRWKEELNLAKELEFARVEPTKWYIWALGILTVPSMSEEREELAKAGCFVYIIDDIFDVHGTLEELTLFTEVVNRWENVDIHELPNYMKVCFNALRKQTNDFCLKIQTKYGWNPEDSLRKLWADLCNAFLVEAKWSNSRRLPSSEEYLGNGIVSSGIHVVLAHAFFMLGKGINKNTFHELNSFPSLVSSTATILRLWNDIGTDKNENKPGHDLSYLESYMKENEGCTTESAKEHVIKKISDSWKCLNEEYMSNTSPFSMDFKLACLNFARMAPIVYSHDKIHHLQYSLRPLLISPFGFCTFLKKNI